MNFTLRTLSILVTCTFFSCSEDTLADLLPDPEPVPPVPVLINYEDNVKSITDNNCIVCHGGQFPVAGLRLETYTQVRFAVENKGLIGRMRNVTAPMPPSGLLLPEAQFAGIIEQWEADGFKENPNN